MLSKKTKYAIKALMVLGRNYGKEPMQIVKIADEENIPKKFLEQILLEMRNAGILYSKKGAGGGYSLNKAPEDVFLSQVMRLIDGPIALLPCVSLNFYRSCDECTEEHVCGIRDTFIDVRNAMLQILNDTSIAHLINKEKELNLDIRS
ncbi:RrF2 family transcriptional regulator [Sphingobacterium spiritivorum]|uniref:Transcriptional regulator, Rrf2 family n=1 Tax=Sphingobacterium spiritivorum ATCC 33861 TaxID=525373 RepID=D7VIL4_SPHSI|nr:Rrf2 family transcriptional regulator [Sphingobacterium spiritivorum]EFK59916.1 transcriptional regulator, Rrf2 family [Sphingobacterium spiritivorum ATCC 33861]QQT37449.1 Rrf2 family transcriptional regulator [Sphingobacterium spiritivorum]WQD34243.1 Rrf2 family transcriptional regulator [Sphingobacterium spiritivorum]SUI97066.1 Cysteine metabolism repressor [Sphingobacterium spiritivorum]